MRYAGQSYELEIPFTARFAERFHRAHETAYGSADPARPLEIVNLRVRLVLPTPKPRVRPARLQRTADLRRATVKHKPVWFSGKPQQTPLYDRDRLPPGTRFAGPAVVVEYSSTTVVPPGFACRVDAYHNLILTAHAP